MVRAVLAEKRVPKAFWPEAVQWENHVLNESPILAVKDMTPEEAWSGKKPSVEYFRIFGCVGHVHIPDVKRTKLDDKSVKCVLLGYSSESKAFRIYDPAKKKIHISRDVIFEEEKAWDWSSSNSVEQAVELDWNDKSDGAALEGGNDTPGDADDQADQTGTQGDTGEGTSRMGRVRRPPAWAADFTTGEGLSDAETEVNLGRIDSYEVERLSFVVISYPTSFEEAAQNPKWKQAMDAEINSIEKNQTWMLTEPSSDTKIIGVTWIYKTKLNELGC